MLSLDQGSEGEETRATHQVVGQTAQRSLQTPKDALFLLIIMERSAQDEQDPRDPARVVEFDPLSQLFSQPRG